MLVLPLMLLLIAGIDSIHELDKWMLRKWMNKWGGGRFSSIYILVFELFRSKSLNKQQQIHSQIMVYLLNLYR